MDNSNKENSAIEKAGRAAGFNIAAARTVFGNKPISSAIIVLAAAVLIAVGGHIQHNDTQLFVMGVGCVVGLLGLYVWFVSTEQNR